MTGEPRPLWCSAFAVAGDRAVLVDEVIPVAAEVDLATGAVTATWTWDLAPAHRGRPTATDVVLAGTDVAVASPAAGGVVRIDRRTGTATVVPVPDVVWLATDGTVVWAVERHDGDDEEDEDPEPTPAALWRLAGPDVTRHDAGGEVTALAAVGGQVVLVCRRPGQLRREVAWRPGWRSIRRPGVVLVGDPAAGPGVVAKVRDTSGHIAIDGGTAWLLGFAGERRRRPNVRPLDLATCRLGDGFFLGGDVAAVVAGHLVEHSGGWPGTEVRIHHSDDGGRQRAVSLPRVAGAGQVTGTTVWWRADGSGLVGLDVVTGDWRRIDVALDCRPFVPPVVPPPGVDLAAYEARRLAGLRAAFLGGWRDERGAALPYIEGVTFVAVEARGEFPGAEVVATFRSAARPGILFGRRIALYDELGNPLDEEYADLALMEDVESGPPGLPPAAACVPDADGIVWFPVP